MWNALKSLCFLPTSFNTQLETVRLILCTSMVAADVFVQFCYPVLAPLLMPPNSHNVTMCSPEISFVVYRANSAPTAADNSAHEDKMRTEAAKFGRPVFPPNFPRLPFCVGAPIQKYWPIIFAYYSYLNRQLREIRINQSLHLLHYYANFVRTLVRLFDPVSSLFAL